MKQYAGLDLSMESTQVCIVDETGHKLAASKVESTPAAIAEALVVQLASRAQSGIAKGEVVHVDASLIRADVSWEALAKRWVDKVGAENEPSDEAERNGKKTGKYKKICTTDPDATMATSGRNQRLEAAYKQYTTVCDEAGIIVDVAITTGELKEGGELVPALERVEATTGARVGIVTVDAAYAYAKVYGHLERT